MNIIGICGDNCSFCSRYLATQDGDTKELEKVKELWVRLGLRDPALPPQDMACYGCRPENNCAYSEVRTCAYGKGIDNCGLCQVYPCKLINAVFEKSEKLLFHSVHFCTPKEMDALNIAFCCNKMSRGSFSADFFVDALKVIGCKGIGVAKLFP